MDCYKPYKFYNYQIYKYICIFNSSLYDNNLFSFIFFIFKILKFIIHDDKTYFFCVFALFLINPWAISPWPIYHSFFFSTLFIYFLIKDHKYSPYISGFFLFCTYLTYTTLYNFVILSFLIFFFLLNLINKY